MYKNIVFDLGGVVVDFNPRTFLMRYFLNKKTEEIVYDLTFGSKEWEELDRGTISRAAANAAMLENAARSGRTFEVKTVIEDWETILRTKEKTVTLLQNLKDAGYHLYYLSNIAGDTLALLKEREFFSLFEGGIASCDVQINKPSPEIYLTLMRTYHLAYAETIFIDDNRQNAQAAFNLGITGVLYKNHKSLLRALAMCEVQAKGIPPKSAYKKRK